MKRALFLVTDHAAAGLEEEEGSSAKETENPNSPKARAKQFFEELEFTLEIEAHNIAKEGEAE